MANITEKNVLLKFISDTKSAEAGIDKVEKKTKGLTKVFDQAAGTFAGIFAFNTINEAVSGFVNITKDVINTTAKFEKSISSLSAITGATGKDLEFYKEQAAAIGAATTLSASEAAEAFKLIASAKPDLLDNAQALTEVTKSAVTLAEASGQTLPEAARALGGALNQFGLDAGDADRVINIFAESQRIGSATVSDLTESLRNAGPAAKAVGLSFEETNAALQTLAFNNIKGAQAGTQLRGALLKLSKQSDDSINPAIVGLETALENLRKKNLGVKEATQLFGAENFTSGQILVNNVGKVKELAEALGKKGLTTAVDQARTNTDNLVGDQSRLRSVIEAVQIEIGSRLIPNIRSLVQFFTGLFQTVKNNIDGILDFTKALGQVAKIVALSVAGIKAYQLALTIGRTIQSAYTAATLLMQAGLFAVTGQARGAQIAMAFFNQTLKANPIGLAVTAITALVGALTLYNKLQRESNGLILDYKKIQEDSLELINQEKTALDLRFDIVNDNTKSDKERLAALNELKASYPAFNALTEKDLDNQEKLRTAYNAANVAIVNRIVARQKEEAQEKLIQAAGEASAKIRELETDATVQLTEAQARQVRGLNAERAAKLKTIEASKERQKRIREEFESLGEDFDSTRKNLLSALGLTDVAIKQSTDLALAGADEIVQSQADKVGEIDKWLKTLTALQRDQLEKQVIFEEKIFNELELQELKALQKRAEKRFEKIRGFANAVAELERELNEELKKDIDQSLKDFEESVQKKLDAEVAYRENLRKVRSDFEKEEASEEEDLFAEDVKRIEENTTKKLVLLQLERQRILASTKEGSKEQIKLLKEIAAEELKVQLLAVRAKLKTIDLSSKEGLDLLREEAALVAALGDLGVSNSNANLEKQLKNIQRVSQESFNFAKQITDQQISNIDREIQASEDKISKLSEQNTTAAKAQIKLEEQRLKALNREREEAQKKAAKIAALEIAVNTALAVSSGIVAVTQAFGKGGNIAVGIATSIALAAQVAAAVASLNNAFRDIPAFATGTEFFNGKGTGTSDSNLAMISRGERVVPADVNKKYHSTLNEFQRDTKTAKLLHMIAKGKIAAPQIKTGVIKGQGDSHNFDGIQTELKELNKKFDRLQMNVKLDKNGFSASMLKYIERQKIKDSYR